MNLIDCGPLVAALLAAAALPQAAGRSLSNAVEMEGSVEATIFRVFFDDLPATLSVADGTSETLDVFRDTATCLIAGDPFILKFCTVQDEADLDFDQEIISPLDTDVVTVSGMPPAAPPEAAATTSAASATTAAASVEPAPAAAKRRLLDSDNDVSQLAAEQYRLAFLRGEPGSARVTTGADVNLSVLDFTRTGTTFDILGGDNWGSVLVFDNVALWGHFASWQTFWKDIASRYFIVHENAAVCFINTAFYLNECATFPDAVNASDNKVFCCRGSTRACTFQAGTELSDYVAQQDIEAPSYLEQIACVEVQLIEPVETPPLTDGALGEEATSGNAQPDTVQVETDDSELAATATDDGDLEAAPVAPAAPSGGGGGGGLSTGAAVGIALLVLIAAAVAALAIFTVRRRAAARSSRSRMIDPATGGAAPRAPNDGSAFATYYCRTANKDALLKKQLGALAKARHCLADRFTLHSRKHVRCDQHGVAVLAAPIDVDSPDDDLEALFYTDAAAFERERAVMRDEEWAPFAGAALRAALPDSDDAPPLLANGLPLPPAMVRVAGDSVRDWARAAKPNMQMTSQTLAALAALLERLHAAGFVHGDVRPESLRWLHQRLEWVFVNFGFSAKAETSTAIHFTIEYMAPEVAAAWESGATSVVLSPAADVWAFGVVAYELLTGRAAFPRHLSEGAIWDQITGRAALPWETLDSDGATNFRARAKGVVLECLHRDGAQRPTAKALRAALQNLVDVESGSDGEFGA